MIATAWNNGAHHSSGAGYGIKLTDQDRELFCRDAPGGVTLELEGWDTPVSVAFNKCGELVSQEIGKWLIRNRLAPWPPRRPPKLPVQQTARGRLAVMLPGRQTISPL